MRFGLSLTDGAMVMAALSVGLPLLICLMTLSSLRRIPWSQRIAVSALVACVTLFVSALGVSSWLASFVRESSWATG
jgi:hypothetical protein